MALTCRWPPSSSSLHSERSEVYGDGKRGKELLRGSFTNHKTAIWKGNVAPVRGFTITMVIDHLLSGMMLQVPPGFDGHILVEVDLKNTEHRPLCMIFLLNFDGLLFFVAVLTPLR